MTTCHRVYWTEDGIAQSENFTSDELSLMLKKCEWLRKRRIEGFDISFIATASEDPNCVSLSGVDVTDSTYDWKKRRK